MDEGRKRVLAIVAGAVAYSLRFTRCPNLNYHAGAESWGVESGMNYASRRAAICLVCSTLLWAQNSPTRRKPAPPAPNSDETERTPSHPPTTNGPVDILTDTRGVDFGPYLKSLVQTVRERWYGAIPRSARPPLNKKGMVLIGFHIMKDGKVTDLHYVESSGDVALDQAGHDSIASSAPFPPLPKEFICEYVALQLHFYYNPAGDFERAPADRQVLPCVTTSVHLVGEVGIRVSPGSAEVGAGAKQQFSAILTRTENSAVSWSVQGPGCKALACGSISADGLYTAPSSVPNPPQVTVTTALASDPSETDSAIVTIVQPNPTR